MFLFADALTTWTEDLAIATFVAAAVASGGLLWSIFVSRSERAEAAKRLKQQKAADDERAERQIKAAQDTADRQVKAAQERLEAQKAADDDRAERQIKAAREAADRQVVEMQAQLDAANRPLLIEVAPNGPMYPDMGARPNPNVKPGSERKIPETIGVRFGVATVELDPRETYAKLLGGFGHLSVPLRNVGRGLAIIHTPGIRLEGDGLTSFESPKVRRERVPVSESTRVSLIFRYSTGLAMPSLQPPSDIDAWRLFVPYTDFAGGQPTFASVGLSRESDDPDDPDWVVVSVDQVALDEFFVGQTEMGRTLRLYHTSTGHQSMLDAEGSPFEMSGGFLLFGTVDGQPIEPNTVSIHADCAALVVTPTGWITAVAPGTDAGRGREAVTRLVEKAPIGGWDIECVHEQVGDDGACTFILKVGNALASTEIEVVLSAAVARGWKTRHGSSLREIVIGNEARRLRGWSMSKIQEQGSHSIIGGIPLA